ncbi:MAG: hypothetical protein ACOC80_10690 [Petrotogales bacterium]
MKCECCSKVNNDIRYFKIDGNHYCGSCVKKAQNIDPCSTNKLASYFVFREIRKERGYNICFFDMKKRERLEVLKKIYEFEKTHPLGYYCTTLDCEREKYKEKYQLEI